MTPQPPLKHPTLPPNTTPGPPPPPPVLLLGHNVQHILYSLYVSALNTLQCSVMKSKIICSSAQYAKQVPHCNGPCFRRYRPQWQMHQLQGAPLHQLTIAPAIMGHLCTIAQARARMSKCSELDQKWPLFWLQTVCSRWPRRWDTNTIQYARLPQGLVATLASKYISASPKIGVYSLTRRCLRPVGYTSLITSTSLHSPAPSAAQGTAQQQHQQQKQQFNVHNRLQSISNFFGSVGPHHLNFLFLIFRSWFRLHIYEMFSSLSPISSKSWWSSRPSLSRGRSFGRTPPRLSETGLSHAEVSPTPPSMLHITVAQWTPHIVNCKAGKCPPAPSTNSHWSLCWFDRGSNGDNQTLTQTTEHLKSESICPRYMKRRELELMQSCAGEKPKDHKKETKVLCEARSRAGTPIKSRSSRVAGSCPDSSSTLHRSTGSGVNAI